MIQLTINGMNSIKSTAPVIMSSKIKKINFINCNIDPNLLKSNCSLKYVDIDDNPMTYRGFVEILKALAQIVL